MKRRQILALVCAALLLLSGCGGASGGAVMNKAEAPAAPAPAPEASFDYATGAPSEPQLELPMAPEYSVGATGDSVYQRPDAKLIRRCSIGIQTTEFDAAVEALYALVNTHGGYFENSASYGGGYYNANARRSGDYIVRVPAGNYNNFRTGVGELGYVTNCNESTEDIGEQYYDTEARLKTLRTKQDRLLMLLEKAETMEDIITLESALGDVEYEIERYSSTLNRYDGLVNFATFNINISEVIRVEETVGQADSLVERMGAGLRSGLEDLKENTEDFMVWVSYNLVNIVIVLVVIVGAATVIRRKKAGMPKLPKLRRKKKDQDSEN